MNKPDSLLNNPCTTTSPRRILLSIEEVAAILGVHRDQVTRMVAEGAIEFVVLPGMKRKFFRREAIAALLEKASAGPLCGPTRVEAVPQKPVKPQENREIVRPSTKRARSLLLPDTFGALIANLKTGLRALPDAAGTFARQVSALLRSARSFLVGWRALSGGNPIPVTCRKEAIA